ncbi:UNVERIFIED_CONTAM: hypothetical protein GTU68_010858 [Idotea baltica]|nr:hypothetical protein [Idotea baltica]
MLDELPKFLLFTKLLLGALKVMIFLIFVLRL